MIKTILLPAAFLFAVAGFTPVHAQKVKQNSGPASKGEVKFLDNIEVNPAPVSTSSEVVVEDKSGTAAATFARKNILTNVASLAVSSIESATALQFKFALLLDTEVEAVTNLGLYQRINEWFGVPYHMGGTTKEGIDCSAFTQMLCSTFFNILLPRTARDQFKFVRSISRTELKEGDLVFFNTSGGISHVGLYLQNNKFVHASTSEGVTISDLFDPYWVKRFVGCGRYEGEAQQASTTTKP